MRALLDMPVGSRLLQVLESFGYEGIHAQQVGMERASDSELLDCAREQGLLLITADLYLPRFLALVSATGPGVIIFRNGGYSDAGMVKLLEGVLRDCDSLTLDRSVCVVDTEQVRITRLPVRVASNPVAAE